MNGESEKVDSEAVENWLERLKTIIALYEPSDIFNADELDFSSSACQIKRLIKQAKNVLMEKNLKNAFRFFSQLVRPGENSSLWLLESQQIQDVSKDTILRT